MSIVVRSTARAAALITTIALIVGAPLLPVTGAAAQKATVQEITSFEPDGNVIPADEPAHSTRNASTDVLDVPGKPKTAKKNTRTLVIMAYSHKKDDATPAILKTAFFDQLDRWMRWESAGRQGEKGKVTKWLKVKNVSCADNDRYFAKAVAAAKRGGYRPGAYKRIAVYFPQCGGLNWAGLGSVGTYGDGKFHMWLNGTASLQVVAHEALHNYGLLHSASMDCNKKSLPKSTRGCTISGYGDTLDIMGNTDLAMSASAKLEVGWLSAKQRKTVKSGSKTFTIAADESASSGVKLVRAYLGKKKFIDIEYRAASALDIGLDVPGDFSTLQSGVQVRLVVPHNRFSDHGRTLIDVQPNNDTSSAAIPAGQSWTTFNRIRVSVIRATSKSATVKVSFKAPKAKKPATPAPPVLAVRNEGLGFAGVEGVASVVAPKGNGMPVLEYDAELSNSLTGTTSTTVDARGGAATTIGLSTLSYGATYKLRLRAKNEVGHGGWSAWSAPLAVVEPVPVIAATSFDAGTVSASTTLRGVTVIVTPGSATAQTTVVMTVSVYGESYDPGTTEYTYNNYYRSCTATLIPGTSDTYRCLDESVGLDEPIGFGTGTLTVDASDQFFRYASKTVAFTATP